MYHDIDEKIHHKEGLKNYLINLLDIDHMYECYMRIAIKKDQQFN